MSSLPTDRSTRELEARLKSLDGLVLSRQESLARRTTLQIGGPAELFARVLSAAALGRLLDEADELRAPCRILGLGSNVLLPDEGLAGVTAVLEGDFLEMSFRGTSVVAGGGLPLARVARAAVERRLTGMEALAGFPSTVGGAVIMNAGCYGVEIKDILESVTVVQPGGLRRQLRVGDLSAGYRSTNLQGSDAVVTQAMFRLRPDDEGVALSTLQDLNRRRREAMPSGRPNAGSVFKNPTGDHAGRLIDECGLKGSQRGGAAISSVHANVIVNNGGATAEDVLELMWVMHRAVADKFEVSLQPELILGGSLKNRWHHLLGDS